MTTWWVESTDRGVTTWWCWSHRPDLWGPGWYVRPREGVLHWPWISRPVPSSLDTAQHAVGAGWTEPGAVEAALAAGVHIHAEPMLHSLEWQPNTYGPPLVCEAQGGQ